MAVSDVYSWPHADLVAAVTSVAAEAERCPGCGLTEGEAWWVESELHQCPTCESRDRELDRLKDMKSTAGWRARFAQLATVEESEEYSAAARFTLEGAKRRAEARKRRRANSVDVT
jgi:hypothetical protein